MAREIPAGDKPAVLWQDPSTGEEWAVSFRLMERADRVECLGVFVEWAGLVDDGEFPDLRRARREPPVLAFSMLRRVPFAKLARQVVEETPTLQKLNRAMAERTAKRLGLELGVPSQPRPHRARGRRPLYGDEHYRRVALIYSAALRERGKPTEAVAEHFKLSKSAAAKHISKARRLGHLPETSRGRARGLASDEPTDTGPS